MFFLVKLKDGAEPCAVTFPHRVSTARREPLQRGLERMTDLKVIEKVDHLTDWCSPCVVIPKNRQIATSYALTTHS